MRTLTAILMAIATAALADVGVYEFWLDDPATMMAAYTEPVSPTTTVYEAQGRVRVKVVLAPQAWSNGWAAVTDVQKQAAASNAMDRVRSARYDADDILRAVAAELVSMCNSNRAVIRKAHGISAANFPNVTEAAFKAAVKQRLQ